MSLLRRHCIPTLFAGLATGFPVASLGAAPLPIDDAWVRIVETESAITLEAVSRAYAPANGTGPVVHLVSAIHIGDWAYYDRVQALLDEIPVVLWEGVGGGYAAVDDPALAQEPERETTRRRVRFLDTVARLQSIEPASLAAIAATAPDGFGPVVEAASIDAWGNELVITSDDDGWAVVSLGADGKPGGEGANADVRSDEPSSPPETSSAEGLQADMAAGLGLTFQFDGIDYQRVHWRNSDLSVSELRRAFAGERVAARPGGARPLQPEVGPTSTRPGLERPASSPSDSGVGSDAGSGTQGQTQAQSGQQADALLQTLSGEGVFAGAMRFMSRVVGRTPASQANAKIMLAEVLIRSDELMAMQAGPVAEMLDVLIHERNDRVMYDIDQIRAHEPDVDQIAVFYGGGHLAGMSESLLQRGYKPAGALWIPAIRIDLQAPGVDTQQALQARRMIGTFLDMSMPRLPEASD